MSSHQFRSASGELIDARFEVQDRRLILRSRGGTKGTPTARNTQYGTALRLLLGRIRQSALTLTGVWVDSNRVQHLSLQDRRILSPEENDIAPAELFTLLSRRMVVVGRDPEARRGNPNKKLRFEFDGRVTDEQIIRIVGLGDLGHESSGRGRLAAATLKNVSDDHIWRAIQQLRFEHANHEFGESQGYDVVDDEGNRWPPKAVFGLAATIALGFEVKPEHFESSPRQVSHQAITNAGFSIIGKLETIRSESMPLSEEDRAWFEGKRKLVRHLKRERSTGIARAKKTDFKRTHGRLYCERCDLDPIEMYGPRNGEACIEVHHKIPLAGLSKGHYTQLRDLMCLCANCHRIEHSKLRNTG